jgi:2-polyprenyl-3-methyl-5-hydroxy-6-metoxy-1,4-benzoquinol methylase
MAAPTDWLVEHRALLPTSGLALDVACGRGRHAWWLAQQGLRVRAVDCDPDAIAALCRRAARARLAIDAAVVDLETSAPPSGTAIYDVVVVVHYLHRPLFPWLVSVVRPGGLLIYETFTTAQARRGKPRNPAFLLEPGELGRLVAPLEVIRAREGEFGGRDVAAVVARAPAG